MILLLLSYLLASAACLIPGRRLGRSAFWVGAAPLVVTVAWLLSRAGDVLGGEVLEQGFAWVPALGLDMALRLDGFAWLMALLVSGIGALVLLYSSYYWKPTAQRSAGDDLGRLAGLLVAFAGSMLGLVLSDGFATLFVFWEATTVTSYLLIGLDGRSADAHRSARQAFLVTGAGGLALLGGLILLGQQSDTTSISALLAAPPRGTVTTVAVTLVLVGALAKSAQFPLHFWLPGAMAAPTPVSAYLHSATMVKAGIVVVARLAPAFAELGSWKVLVLGCGSASMLLGGVQALRQQDAKLALAHGTVSQLGLIMLLVGLGTPLTTYAGVAVLAAHALFKAGLFMAVGVVDHQTGTRDMRRLGRCESHRLAGRLPALASIAVLCGASMAALPPTFGFVAKEKGLDALLHAPAETPGLFVLVAVLAGSVLTVAYSVRTLDGIFWRGTARRSSSQDRADLQPVDVTRVPRPAGGFLAAPVVLATASVLFGVLAARTGELLADVSASLDEASAEGHLVLWPGWGEALALSALTWLLGVALVTALHRLRSGVEPTAGGWAARAFESAYEGLLVGARRLTAFSQSGSLPAYLALVVATVPVAVTAIWISPGLEVGSLEVTGSAVQVLTAVAVAALSVAVTVARRRFTAAVLLGACGLGISVLFLAWGAPDLAMTQLLVEVVTVVLFLLVLSRLPERFEEPKASVPVWMRRALAVGFGTAVSIFALVVSASRTAPSVGREYLARAEPEAGGRNVVNVILVDFRGFDTLGEITVLAVTAIGVVNLVRVARLEQRRKQLADGVDLGSVGSDSARTATPVTSAASQSPADEQRGAR